MLELLFFFFLTRVGQVITIKAKVTRAFSTSMEVRGSLFFLLPVGAHFFIVYRGERRRPGITWSSCDSEFQKALESVVRLTGK